MFLENGPEGDQLRLGVLGIGLFQVAPDRGDFATYWRERKERELAEAGRAGGTLSAGSTRRVRMKSMARSEPEG